MNSEIIHESSTPLMRQYHAIKQSYADALLLFQVGDFYELFFEDAKKAAACLAITLTKRGHINGEPIPLCGVPIHAVDFYVTKLIRAGFKVALCNQLEEATPGKVVERGVTQLLTPGTLTDTSLLDAKTASYVLSFFPQEHYWGLVFGELMTAQLFATVIPSHAEKIIETELTRFFPDEILIPNSKFGRTFQPYFQRLGYYTSSVDVDADPQELSLNQFNGITRERLLKQESAKLAWINFYAYMHKTNPVSASQFNAIQFYQPDQFLMIDSATQHNLELVKNGKDGSKQHTLFQVLDGAVTPMGSRTIKKWIMRPLVQHEQIVTRQQAIAYFVQMIAHAKELELHMQAVGDVERVVGRIALRRATIHDYVLLQRILEKIPQIGRLLQVASSPLLLSLGSHVTDFSALYHLLSQALNDDASREWVIKKGFNPSLDALRDIVDNATSEILQLEQAEQQLTGINSLKIRQNDVHGYYIEITKTHAHAIPERYIRRQSLVGRERFTTPELQCMAQKISHAHAQVASVEQEVFEQVKHAVYENIAPLRKLAYSLAQVDALLGLARVAYANSYVCPEFNNNRDILIDQGRHPIVEKIMNSRFIANDSALTDAQSFLIITGPNMGGKSTYLRQVALISLMAHIGSFVPAKKASLSILDRIFTRIGAGDNLAEGKSTFLVEMEEAATICTQATRHSLVILDEVGRGTSTFDGLALAQAIVEYLYTKVQARCLFATHYHELTALQEQFSGIKNYYAANRKTDAGIIFLYTMIPGVADGSFGIEVAKLAQLPRSIIERATDIVELLHDARPAVQQQSQELSQDVTEKIRQLNAQVHMLEQQLSALKSVDYENLSPKLAFDLVWKLKDLQ